MFMGSSFRMKRKLEVGLRVFTKAGDVPVALDRPVLIPQILCRSFTAAVLLLLLARESSPDGLLRC